MTEIDIKIVSDVVCPWCVIGSRNLQRALESLEPDINAHVSWRPFQLNPGMVDEGENLSEHIMRKYGSSAEDSQAMRDRVTELGANTGFRFNFGPDTRTYNTFDAHRILHWARTQGRDNEFAEALFAAYFTHGQNPSAPETLREVATALGMDATEIDDILASDRYRDEVTRELEQSQQMGVTGVPTVIINDRYAITGGQPPETFAQALRKIADQEATNAP